MIEPVPAIYQRLVAKHGAREGIIFENVAIASAEGTRAFYTVEPDAADRHSWIDQLGSFNRDVILTHESQIDGLRSRIRTSDVVCVPLGKICARHNVSHIDLLHVDTEGADLEVLGSLDWNLLRPDLVLFEHKHLNPRDRSAAEEILLGLSYELYSQNGDTLAVRQALLASNPMIRKAWKLRPGRHRASA
jgi:FkbM family methyltransferase